MTGEAAATAPAGRAGGTRALVAIVASLLVGLTVVFAPIGWEELQQRRLLRSQESLQALAERLEAVRLRAGRYPCEGVGDARACMELGIESSPRLRAEDAWGRPYVLVVTKAGASAMLLSRGSDGMFEPQIGGPYLRREHWRDLAMLDGAIFQSSRMLNCARDHDDTQATRIAQEREVWALHWDSEALAGMRAIHATIPAR